MNERIVCLDIGDARIGVAVSDPTGSIATPLEVIHRIGWGPDTKRIKSIAEKYETNRVLSGLPLNMDGSEGFQAEKVRSFCSRLEDAGLSICYQDERLTTVTAEDALIRGGMSRPDRKQTVDKIAAAVILQQWLDSNHDKGDVSEMSENKFQDMENSEFSDDEPSLAEGDLIELIDDQGETVSFVFVDAVEYQGGYYLALTDREEDDAVFFLKLERNESGQDVYSAPDESMEDALFKQFIRQQDQKDEMDP